MKAILLHRINPERNEKRFYRLEVGPALFDPIAVIRYWGRIDGGSREMITPCASVEAAMKLFRKIGRQKLKGGYIFVEGDILDLEEPAKKEIQTGAPEEAL